MNSMDAKNTARGILCKRIDRAPKTRYVRLVRMKPHHEKVCFVVSEEANDGVYLLALHKMGLKFDSFTHCSLAGRGVQSFVSLHPITVDHQRERRVCSVGIGGVSGSGLKDRYCPQFSAQYPGQAELQRLAHGWLRAIRCTLP